MYKTKEIAGVLGLSRQRVHKLIMAGKLAAVRVPGGYEATEDAVVGVVLDRLLALELQRQELTIRAQAAGLPV